MIEGSAARYTGLLRLRKVDPPVRVLGSGKFRRVIFLENPWCDFVGSWTERGGRMVVIECKSTAEPKLTFDSPGGVTTEQVDALRHWMNAGAAAFVLWEHAGYVRMLNASALARFRDAARDGTHFKYVAWDAVEMGTDLPQGVGFCVVDFLPEMRARWPK